MSSETVSPLVPLKKATGGAFELAESSATQFGANNQIP